MIEPSENQMVPAAPRSRKRKPPPMTSETASPPSAGGELSDAELLAARLNRARTLQPGPRERHCMDCFRRGRDAAIRVVEG